MDVGMNGLWMGVHDVCNGYHFQFPIFCLLPILLLTFSTISVGILCIMIQVTYIYTWYSFIYPVFWVISFIGVWIYYIFSTLQWRTCPHYLIKQLNINMFCIHHKTLSHPGTHAHPHTFHVSGHFCRYKEHRYGHEERQQIFHKYMVGSSIGIYAYMYSYLGWYN